MTKDEMKNRISLALKDSILQQGFEIICKNLAELETEHNKLLDVINNQDVKIADLEKQIEKMKCCENCKYNSYWGNELHCNYGLKEAIKEDKLVECKNMDKWEIKGNDRM